MNVTVMTADQRPLAPPVELEQKALTLAERVSGLVVNSQETYDRGYELGQAVNALIKEAEDHHRPLIAAALNTHRLALAALAKFHEPLSRDKATIKGKLTAYSVEQRRLKAEEDARVAAEQRRQQMEQIRLESEARAKAEAEARAINEAARRKAEEEQEAAAALAEAQGATVAEIEAILMAPLAAEEVAPAPVYVPQARYVPPPASTAKAPKGATGTWDGEVFDKRALCAAIGRGEASPNLIDGNSVAVRALARVEQAVTLSVPGIRGVFKPSVSIRG